MSPVFKLPRLFHRSEAAPSPEERSDFGRRFGWFIEKNGERIGELDYLRWDSWLQFWHEYRVTWRSPDDVIVGPDAWISAKLVLRNRRYTDVVDDSFLTAPQRDAEIIAVRGASVSADRISRDENG